MELLLSIMIKLSFLSFNIFILLSYKFCGIMVLDVKNCTPDLLSEWMNRRLAVEDLGCGSSLPTMHDHLGQEECRDKHQYQIYQ